MATFSLSRRVTAILKKSDKPLKARAIASQIRKDTGHDIGRKDVNSVLYFELRGKVEKNEDHAWKMI